VEKVEPFPIPYNWTEVLVTWNEIMNVPYYDIKGMLTWAEEYPGSRYHLLGYKHTEGFVFRFEDPKDATYFKLKWL
jgi:hypothetical protein